MKNNDLPDSSLIETYRKVGPYLGLGTQLALTIVLMFFLGRWLDSEFSSFPVFTIVMLFLGSFAGLYNFIKTVLSLNKKDIEKNNNSDT